METKNFITEEPKTAIRKSHYGWNGETYVKIKGFCYMITTSKGYSGFISSTARKVNDHGSSNGFRGVSFQMFGGDSWDLVKEKATATEAKIRELHTQALEKFKAMENELPSKDEAYEIKPGQVLISIGQGLSEERNNVVYKVDDDKYYYVNKKDLYMSHDRLHFLKDIRKQFGIGMYYEEGDLMDVDEVNELVMDAIEKQKRDAEEAPAKAAAAKAEKEAAIAQLKAKYPYLNETKDRGGVSAAKNIRIELARHFPGVKFSVTSDYDKVEISWKDGPITDTVSAITGKYEDHKTDETGDFRDPAPSLFNNVFGGCKYVFEERSMSNETERILMQWANECYEKGEKYDTHHTGNLAYRLFVDYEIPVGGFRIMPKETTGGVNRPATFWEVVAVSDSPPPASSGSEEAAPKPVETSPNKSISLGDAKVAFNAEKNGIEISFPQKPADEMLDALKKAGFRWSRFNRVWWAKRSPELQSRIEALLKA